MQALSYCKADK